MKDRCNKFYVSEFNNEKIKNFLFIKLLNKFVYYLLN